MPQSQTRHLTPLSTRRQAPGSQRGGSSLLRSRPARSESNLPSSLPHHRVSRNDELGELLASAATDSPSLRPTNHAGITTRPIRNATKRTFCEASSSSGIDSDPILRSDDELSNILPQGVNSRPSRAWEMIPYEARRVANAAKKKIEYIALMVNPWPNATGMEEILIQVWAESCHELGEDATRCTTASKSLKQSLSAVRGHLVRDAKANVLELFPYLANARNNAERRERTEHLLEKDRFLVPDRYHGEEEIGGYWRSEAIGRLIYLHFFARQRQKGNKDPEAFLQRMTSAFLCIIACALRHALTQFEETGERKSIVDFNEASQLAHWNRFARYWTTQGAARAVSWMRYIQNQVDRMLESKESSWDTVRQEPYALNEHIERQFDGIRVEPIRARERLHMVRPRDIHDATIQVQQRGNPTDRPLFETSETELDDSYLYERPSQSSSTTVENDTLERDTDESDGADPLRTSEDPDAQSGPRKRSRAIIVEEDEEDE